MDSVAAWKDGENHSEINRPNKKQRTLGEEGERQLPGPWKKKGSRFILGKASLRAVSDKQRSWEKIFDRLEEYYARHGDSNVSVYWEDRELVAWVAEQRSE